MDTPNLDPADLAWIIDADLEDGMLERVDERTETLNAHDLLLWRAAMAAGTQ